MRISLGTDNDHLKGMSDVWRVADFEQAATWIMLPYTFRFKSHTSPYHEALKVHFELKNGTRAHNI